MNPYQYTSNSLHKICIPTIFNVRIMSKNIASNLSCLNPQYGQADPLLESHHVPPSLQGFHIDRCISSTS